MEYRDFLTLSVATFIVGIFLMILSVFLYFKLDIKSIIKIFLRKLRVVVLVLIALFVVFGKEVAADERDFTGWSDIRFKEKTFFRDGIYYYSGYEGMSFGFFIKCGNTKDTDIMEIYVDDILCYKSFSGDNLSSEIPIILKKGYIPSKITVLCRAKSGNLHVDTFNLSMDNEGPVINEDSIVVEDSKGIIDLNKWIKAFITGENIVRVALKDVIDEKSGIESLFFKYNTGNGQHTIKAEYDEEKEEYYALVNLPKDSNREFFVVSRDNLLNISTTDEGFIDIIASNSSPVISVAKSGNYYDTEDESVFKEKLTLSINIEDVVGLCEIYGTVNSETFIVEKDIFSGEGGLEKNYKFYITEENLIPGKNEIRILVKNYGGHESTEDIVVFSDNSPPLLDYSYIGSGNEGVEEDLVKYYSDKDLKVSLKFADVDDYGLDRDMDPKNVFVSLYDFNGALVDVISPDITSKDEIVFYLKCGFKGFGIIRAEDRFLNTYTFKTRNFIVEGKDQFLKASSIAFLKEKEDFSGKEVKLPIVVKSDYSGIKEVRYSIDAPGDIGENKEGVLALDGKYDDVMISGKGSIAVNNNSNDIKVSVKLLSNAGNILEEYITLNIDKTPPKIRVWFEDGENGSFINHDRIFHIEITERNFLKENTGIHILENNRDIGGNIEFTKIPDDNNPLNDKYTGKIKLSNEGEYSIYGGTKDRAGNVSSINEICFILDKTPPVGEIIYLMGDSAEENSGYINRAFSMKIRIKEDNLDLQSLRIIGDGNINHKNYTYVDGIYENIMYFDSSGECQIMVTGSDYAGNQLNQLISNKYILDLTIPEILINNLTNNMSCNGEVSFSGEISDDHLDMDNSIVSLNKLSGGNTPLISINKNDNKILFSVDEIPVDLEYDGIYELELKAGDFSGNTVFKSYRFSVNRFGSTFMPSEDFLNINNSFVRTMDKVDIVEVNYDTIDPEYTRVFLFRNGNTRLLNMEKDYEIYKSDNGFSESLTYSIKGENFKEDGIYAIFVFSMDKAGNYNRTNSGKEIYSFVVDRTPPRIFSLNVASNEEYTRPVTMELKAFDNMKLSDVSAFNNEAPIDVSYDGNTYKINLSANHRKYNIKLCAKDAAGNSFETKIKNVSVGNENSTKRKEIIVRFALLLLGIMSIILLVVINKRSIHGKRTDREAY